MKRDLDLIRLILLNIEDLPKQSQNYYFFEGCDEDAFDHNMKIMIDQGLVEAKQWPTHNRHPGRWYSTVRLTWQGHDFLDSVRDDEIWRQTKAGAEKAKGFTFDLLKKLASGLIETQLEKYTGVKLGN